MNSYKKIFLYSVDVSFDQTPIAAQAGPEHSSFATLEVMSPRDIAYQLTSQDHDLFNATSMVIGLSFLGMFNEEFNTLEMFQ